LEEVPLKVETVSEVDLTGTSNRPVEAGVLGVQARTVRAALEELEELVFPPPSRVQPWGTAAVAVAERDLLQLVLQARLLTEAVRVD
jgi:hypothetical protein